MKTVHKCMNVQSNLAPPTYETGVPTTWLQRLAVEYIKLEDYI
jgi:hypothetical protein